MLKLRNACYLAILLFFCCRKPYTPPAISSAASYLVVEGAINSGSDSTVITLSKTVNVGAGTTVNSVLNATVTVQSDQNNSWPLTGDGRGNYYSSGLNLPSSQNYRLNINTSDGKQYLSDFIAVKPTPPIDSIGYTIVNNTVQLYVNTHDPANNTHYYRWVYDETWQFNAKYRSDYVLDTNTNTIVQRTMAQNVYSCFGNDISSNILLTSTAKLSKDVVYKSPLTTIPLTSEKFETKYSILVKQYALTPDAYTFYQNIKTNTEQLGSIFDAQPSQISGNIHNVDNANEPVIGYITVTNVQTKRIFISGSIVPSNIYTLYPYNCGADSALYKDAGGLNDVGSVLIDRPITDQPLEPILAGNIIIGYTYSSLECADCTLRGTTATPAFWK